MNRVRSAATAALVGAAAGVLLWAAIALFLMLAEWFDIRFMFALAGGLAIAFAFIDALTESLTGE